METTRLSAAQCSDTVHSVTGRNFLLGQESDYTVFMTSYGHCIRSGHKKNYRNCQINMSSYTVTGQWDLHRLHIWSLSCQWQILFLMNESTNKKCLHVYNVETISTGTSVLDSLGGQGSRLTFYIACTGAIYVFMQVHQHMIQVHTKFFTTPFASQ